MAGHTIAYRRSVWPGVAKAYAQQCFAQLSVRCQRNRGARVRKGIGNPVVHEPGVSAVSAKQLDNWQSSNGDRLYRYDLQAHEPQGLQREWSLMNVLNQKGTRLEDKPIRFGQLIPEDQRR